MRERPKRHDQNEHRLDTIEVRFVRGISTTVTCM